MPVPLPAPTTTEPVQALPEPWRDGRGRAFPRVDVPLMARLDLATMPPCDLLFAPEGKA